MTLPALNDVVEITIEAEFDDTEDVVNVYQFKNVGAAYTTEALWQDDLKTLVEALVDILKGYASIYTVWRRYRARNLTQDTPSEQFELDTATAGVIAGNSLPAGSAVLLAFRTQQPKVVLKKFHGVAAEALSDADAKWSSSTLATGVTDIATMISVFTLYASSWRYGHYHTPTAQFLYPTSGYINAEPAYQRRRRRGTGS